MLTQMKPCPLPRLFAGCDPNVFCDGGGRIVAVGADARTAAPPDLKVVELDGRVLPGTGDSHIHLDELVLLRVGLDLRPTSSLRQASRWGQWSRSAIPTMT